MGRRVYTDCDAVAQQLSGGCHAMKGTRPLETEPRRGVSELQSLCQSVSKDVKLMKKINLRVILEAVPSHTHPRVCLVKGPNVGVCPSKPLSVPDGTSELSSMA